MVANSTIETLDVHFDGKPGIIAVYLIRHTHGALLIDCGPGSTVPALVNALAVRDVAPRDITDVVLTHIHLDHGGAAGWWAREGATVHVHPVGAPHLLQPDRLLASAQRIYGSDMERLWGSFLPVPEAQLHVVTDNETLELGGRKLTALNTPGHAEHHYAYLFEDVCFSGDVGGVRLAGLNHVRPPTPPPEIDFRKWRASIARIRDAKPARIAPTHFGIYDDPARQLTALERNLDAIEAWTARAMQASPSQDEFRSGFRELYRELALADGYTTAQVATYGDAAGSDMSADGVYRYWLKHIAPPAAPSSAQAPA